ETRDITHLLRREQPVGDQHVGAHQQRIPGKGRKALVGRVAIPGGTEREYVPQALLCSHKKIDKARGLMTQIANAVAARQRGRMQYNATTTRKAHAGSSAERHLSHTGPLRWRPLFAYRFSQQESHVFCTPRLMCVPPAAGGIGESGHWWSCRVRAQARERFPARGRCGWPAPCPAPRPTDRRSRCARWCLA